MRFDVFDAYGNFIGSIREAPSYGAIIILAIAIPVGIFLVLTWLVFLWIEWAAKLPIVVIPATIAIVVGVHVTGVLYPPTPAEKLATAEQALADSAAISSLIAISEPGEFSYDNYWDGRDSSGDSEIYFDLPIVNASNGSHDVELRITLRADVVKGKRKKGKEDVISMAWIQTLKVPAGTSTVPISIGDTRYDTWWFSKARDFRAEIVAVDGVSVRAPSEILESIDVSVKPGEPRLVQFDGEASLNCRVDITNRDSVTHVINILGGDDVQAVDEVRFIVCLPDGHPDGPVRVDREMVQFRAAAREVLLPGTPVEGEHAGAAIGFGPR